MKLTVLLFVPGDRPERYAKAVSSGADAAIVDLEDAVAPANKAQARQFARSAFGCGLEGLVRFNPASTEFGLADIEAFGGLHPQAILVPKVEQALDLEAARLIAPVIPLIESAKGVRNIDEIAAVDNVIALAFGAFDLCAELGAQPIPEVLAPFRAAIVAAARLATIAVIDAPFLEIDDLRGLREDAKRAVAFGFDGKLAIHPKHVKALRDAFTPSAEEIRHARAVLTAVERGGVAVVDGKMVDPPIVAAARRVLERAPTQAAME